MAQASQSKLKVCPYGEKCYRKNPIHFGEFSHPHLDAIYDKGPDPRTHEYIIPGNLISSKDLIMVQLKLIETVFLKSKPSEAPSTSWAVKTKGSSPNSEALIIGKRVHPTVKSNLVECNDNSNLEKKPKIVKNIKDYIPVVLAKGGMADKLARAAPYNMFLTAITDSKPTHQEPLTVTLQEILDESLGDLESSVQINFMVEIGWLLGHYYFAGKEHSPLLVLYGDETQELRTISQYKPNVTAIKVNMSSPFGTSHTKMMLLAYKDGSLRIVISTANLYEDDWHNRTQGVWISPTLPALSEEADTAAGESPTNFRQDLMLYLVEYKIEKLQPWIARIRKTDFRSIKVFLVASVPGGFCEGIRGYSWGHPRLGGLLQKHAGKIEDRIPIVCQSSSIGSLGQNIQAWIQYDFLNSLRKNEERLGIRPIPVFKMIYPSFENVRNSHDGMLGGGCLPYSKNTNDKQPWLKTHLHQWSASQRFRSKAMPHIKTYTRFNLEDQCVYWFVLTSANLSKAAWGSFNKNTKIQPTLRINNYEAGVLFLPQILIGANSFPLGHDCNGIPPFPMPYDVPLTPYSIADTPFLMDYLRQ